MHQALGLLMLWLIAGALTFGIGFFLFPVVYLLLVLRGCDARAAKARQKLKTTLMKDEQVITTAIQVRIAALLVRRELVAITNSRIIVIARPWFGGFDMRDYQWKDLYDARLKENVLPNFLGSRLTFAVNSNKPPLVINGVASDIASQIYSHAQGEEHAWEEKRRVRAMEETRAASGGVTISGLSAASNTATSLIAELTTAKSLFDSGAVSDAEFHEIKAKILSR